MGTLHAAVTTRDIPATRTQTLPAAARKDKARQLKKLRRAHEDAKFTRREFTMGARYHGIKFFERQKLTRRLKAVQRYMRTHFNADGTGTVAVTGPDADALLLSLSTASVGQRHAGLNASMLDTAAPVSARWSSGNDLVTHLKADILYTRWFPRHCKYVGIIGGGGDGTKTADPGGADVVGGGGKGLKMYRWAMHNAVAGSYLRDYPGEEEGAPTLSDLIRQAVSMRWDERRGTAQTLPRNVRLDDGDGDDEEEEEEEDVAGSGFSEGSSHDQASSSGDDDADAADSGEEGRAAPVACTMPISRSSTAASAGAAAPRRGCLAAPLLPPSPGGLRIVEVPVPQRGGHHLRPAADEEEEAVVAAPPRTAPNARHTRGDTASNVGKAGDGEVDMFLLPAEGEDGDSGGGVEAYPTFVEEGEEAGVGGGDDHYGDRVVGGGGGGRVLGPRTSAARWEREHLHAPRYRDVAAQREEGGPDLSHLSGRKRRRAERALSYASKGGGFRTTSAYFGTDLDPKAHLRSEVGQGGRGGGMGRGGRGGFRGRSTGTVARGGGSSGGGGWSPRFGGGRGGHGSGAAAPAGAPTPPARAPGAARKKNVHVTFDDE